MITVIAKMPKQSKKRKSKSNKNKCMTTTIHFPLHKKKSYHYLIEINLQCKHKNNSIQLDKSLVEDLEDTNPSNGESRERMGDEELSVDHSEISIGKQTNTEYGTCCFCKSACNPCSQACGFCMRSGNFY